MKKRSLSCVLVILLLLSLAVPAMAASPALTIRSPGALPDTGQSFTVRVELAGNPGICTAQFALLFDGSVVACTEVTLGSVLGGMLAATNPNASDGARVACASATPVFGDGVLAEFRFRVLKSGSPNFSLSDMQMNDEEGREIPYTVSAIEEAEEEEPGPGGGTTPVPPDLPDPPAQSGPDFPDTVDHWCREYASQAAALGLFKGNTDGSFRPDDAVTRAQFVTVLYRMAGSPDTAAAAPFTDIAGRDAEFIKAITWAYAEGLVAGRSETLFDPAAPVSRQEAMKVLFAFSGGERGMEMMFTDVYDAAFTDSGSIAAWAKPAVYWAYYHELITGTGAAAISPTGPASRGQLAKILVNYIEKFGN